ncbi:unnamed protein product [Owenia fusiformis]|uniref:Uncharacterized protein n=1 Tax=Owenia fusiformis TaxID=6347 RepID=A0A8S4PWX9_OWEFU|nr:unnamed protein product [Owenia fusiformis]
MKRTRMKPLIFINWLFIAFMVPLAQADLEVCTRGELGSTISLSCPNELQIWITTASHMACDGDNIGSCPCTSESCDFASTQKTNCPLCSSMNCEYMTKICYVCVKSTAAYKNRLMHLYCNDAESLKILDVSYATYEPKNTMSLWLKMVK